MANEDMGIAGIVVLIVLGLLLIAVVAEVIT